LSDTAQYGQKPPKQVGAPLGVALIDYQAGKCSAHRHGVDLRDGFDCSQQTIEGGADGALAIHTVEEVESAGYTSVDGEQ
jgi:hypothetical protein